jgi:hypothetical protein
MLHKARCSQARLSPMHVIVSDKAVLNENIELPLSSHLLEQAHVSMDLPSRVALRTQMVSGLIAQAISRFIARGISGISVPAFSGEGMLQLQALF